METPQTSTRAVSAGAFRLGAWLCEPELNTISGAGSVASIEPKIMQVLVILAGRPGQVVSREQLLDAVWVGTFVGEQVLSRAVSELRKVFGDDARNARVIETIAKKGYRLLVAVEAIDVVEAAEPDAIVSPLGGGRLAAADRMPWRLAAGGVAALLVAVAIAALLWWREPPAGSPQVPGPLSLAIVLSEAAPIELSHFQSFAVSGDGRQLVYTGHAAGRRHLYLRTLDRREVMPIPGTEGGSGPFFSPDSTSIAFYAQGRLQVVSIGDTHPRTLAGDAPDAQGADWGPDGTIVFTRRFLDGLSTVAATGGAVEPLTTVDRAAGELSHFWPAILPGGRQALFTVWRGAGSGQSAIDAVDLDSGERTRILEGGSFPRLVSTGDLVFVRGSAVYAVPFDADKLSVNGEPRVVLEDAVIYPFTGIPHLAVSQAGTLVYASRADFSARWSLSWVSADGSRRPAVEERRPYATPQLSPDGARLAATVIDGSMDIWVFDLARRGAERLTGRGESVWPVWSPDGRQIVFSSDRAGAFNLYVKNLDQDVEAERLTESRNIQFAGSISPDGRTVIYAELNPVTRFDVWSVPLDGSAPPTPLLDSQFDEFRPALSPDGRLLAYASNEAGRWDETGRWDVYVRPLDRLDTRIKISTDGGTDPTWSRDGETLFYRQGGRLMAVQVGASPGLQVAPPQVVLEGVEPPDPIAQVPHFDVAADGRWLFVSRGSQGDATQLNVVEGWLQRHVTR